MAVFWFGQVSNTDNYMDVRVGYNDEYLRIRTAAFDRSLWYDLTPSPADLENWDAVTLYLNLNPDGSSNLDSDNYRIVTQLSWWESRDDFQIVYQGNGSNWIATTIPFTATAGWRGNAPNDNLNDRGWTMNILIPFASLGLPGRPADGTVWGMAVAMHDRDDAGGTPILDKVWPETTNGQNPATWGELAFGIPTYTPPAAIPGDTVMVRQGLNGAIVVDAHVGGDTICGDSYDPNYFNGLGDANYAGSAHLNIQNQSDVADWPCYSKAYFTFPLDSLPAGKTIISATLTLHQFGGSNLNAAQPSLIQVHSVNEAWNEASISWNNAPLAAENNVGGTWVDPIAFPGWPGVPRVWDVSRATAQAYAAGTPLGFALYESDWHYHSGKYFVSSDADDWNQVARPTLRVLWGDPIGIVEQIASATFAMPADTLTYTLIIKGTGQPLTLTNELPVGVSRPISHNPALTYNFHHLTWNGTPALGETITLTYVVTVTALSRTTLLSQAILTQSNGLTSTNFAQVLVDPIRVYLPILIKNRS